MTTTETTTAARIGTIADLAAGTWIIDAGHSHVGFSVRHLAVSKVRGHFTSFAGTLTIAEDPLASSVEATIDVASIDTRDEARDHHLRTSDFFAVEEFPTLEFRSTGVRTAGNDYVITGDLTLRGITRTVELALEFHGVSADPWGGTRAGFTAETKIDRKDFGVNWNAPIDGGGVVVGEKVTITLEIEAVRETA